MGERVGDGVGGEACRRQKCSHPSSEMAIGVGCAGRDDAGEPSAPIRRVFGEDVACKLGEVGRVTRGESEYSEFELVANSCVYRGHRGIDGVRAVKPVVALGPEGPRDFPDPSHQLGSPAARGEAL